MVTVDDLCLSRRVITVIRIAMKKNSSSVQPRAYELLQFYSINIPDKRIILCVTDCITENNFVMFCHLKSP